MSNKFHLLQQSMQHLDQLFRRVLLKLKKLMRDELLFHLLARRSLSLNVMTRVPGVDNSDFHQTRFPSSDQLFGKPPVSPYSFYPNTVYITRRATCKQFSIQTSRKEFQSLQKWKSISLCWKLFDFNQLWVTWIQMTHCMNQSSGLRSVDRSNILD